MHNRISKPFVASVLSFTLIFSQTCLIRAEEPEIITEETVSVNETDEPEIPTVGNNDNPLEDPGEMFSEGTGEEMGEKTELKAPGPSMQTGQDSSDIPILNSTNPDAIQYYYGDYRLIYLGNTLVSANQLEGTEGSTLTIPSFTQIIASNAVSENEVLTTLVFEEPHNLFKIEEDAFAKDTNLQNMTLPDSVITLEDGVFRETGLKSFTFPKHLRNLGQTTVMSCNNLTAVYGVPLTLEDCTGTLEGNADSDYNMLEDYPGPGEAPFYDSAVKTITFQENTKRIPAWLFAGCKKLTSVTIPDTVTDMGEFVFEGCYNLKHIKLSSELL